MRIRVIRASAHEFRPLSPLELEEQKEEWQRFTSPGTEIEVVRVLKGVESIESCYDAEIAAPFILEEVRRAEEDGVDGVIIHCMSDPALFAARELIDIPVLGEGLACYATAVTLGDKFSVISPLPGSEVRRRSQLRLYGLEEHLASIRSLDIPVRSLRHDLKALKQAMRDQGKRAIEDGADVIIPGCGEIYGMAQELSEELGVPVIDPRATVVKFAEMLIGMSLSHSKKAYPRPPEKRREI